MLKKMFFITATAILLCGLAAVPRTMMVLEIGTGTWCQYCPGAAMGANDMVSAGKKVAVIKNHNGDTFANTYSNARNSYYGITGYPTSFFDGLNAYVGGSNTVSLYPVYNTRYNSRINVPSNYTLTATGSQTGNTVNVTVTATRIDPDTQSNIRLHGVVTQSNIQHNWQGQTHLEFVTRLMAPNEAGTVLDFSSTGTQNINLVFNLNSAWNPADLEYVFFLQNNSTKEILQGIKYNIQALQNLNPVSVSAFNLGDVNVDEIISRDFVINNWWPFDMAGEISVDNSAFYIQPNTRDPFNIPFMSNASYTLYFVPFEPGLLEATLTVTTNNPAYPLINIPITANVLGTSVDENAVVPLARISAVYPNPFRNSATIEYHLQKNAETKISVYNVKGELVKTVNAGNQAAGLHKLDLDAANLASGVYYCRLLVNDKLSAAKKVSIIR